MCGAAPWGSWSARCWLAGTVQALHPALPRPPSLPTPQDLLLLCMTDPAVDATALLADATQPLSEDEQADVYALRGLLACGVLQHGLTLRHLVDYGVNECALAFVSC